MDRGREFAAEVQRAQLRTSAESRAIKLIATRKPQANVIMECVHQMAHNLIRTPQIWSKNNLDPDFRWSGIISAAHHAVVSTARACAQHHWLHQPN